MGLRVNLTPLPTTVRLLQELSMCLAWGKEDGRGWVNASQTTSKTVNTVTIFLFLKAARFLLLVHRSGTGREGKWKHSNSLANSVSNDPFFHGQQHNLRSGQTRSV